MNVAPVPNSLQMALPFVTPVRIAITGRFRRGKDTLADIIAAELGEDLQRREAPVKRLAFATDLKKELAQMAYVMLHKDKANTPRIDELGGAVFEGFLVDMNAQRAVNGVGWQWLGQWRREQDEDYWIKSHGFQEAFRHARAANKHMLVTDMRHHNEAKWCADNGFFRVRVSGPCRAENETRDAQHESERYIDSLEVDYDYLNGGTITDMQMFVSTVLLPLIRELQSTSLGAWPVVRK